MRDCGCPGCCGSRVLERLSGYRDRSRPDSHHQDSTTIRALRGWRAGGVGKSVARSSNWACWNVGKRRFWSTCIAYEPSLRRIRQSGDLGPNHGCPGSPLPRLWVSRIADPQYKLQSRTAVRRLRDIASIDMGAYHSIHIIHIMDGFSNGSGALNQTFLMLSK